MKIEKLNVFHDILEDDHDVIFRNWEKIELKSSKNGRFYNINLLQIKLSESERFQSVKK